jgi:PPM family protein phosphatase
MPLTSDSEKTTRRLAMPDTESGSASVSPAPTVRIEAAGLSDPGKLREVNQDSFLIARVGRSMDTLATTLGPADVPERFREIGYALIVADGMGGAAAGEVASRLAIRTLVEIALDVPEWVLRVDDDAAERLLKRTADYYHRVDEVLGQHGLADPRLDGMGTTMTMVFSLGADAFVAHVGDSRAYLLRRGRLQQLTRDHTHVQRLVDAGTITRQEAETHALRHVLTNVLGGVDRTVEVDLERFALAEDDRLLLCSDGLSEVVRDGEIAAELERHADPADACRALLDLTLARGAPDNVTVLVARVTFGA